jgi:ATP-dependent DNA ligase
MKMIHRHQDSSIKKNVLGLLFPTIFEFDRNYCPALFIQDVAAYRAGRVHRAAPSDTDSQWLHEIKHDGFRIIARKDGERVRLYSRPGNDMTGRFRLIAKALTGLRSRSWHHRWGSRRVR